MLLFINSVICRTDADVHYFNHQFLSGMLLYTCSSSTLIFFSITVWLLDQFLVLLLSFFNIFTYTWILYWSVQAAVYSVQTFYYNYWKFLSILIWTAISKPHVTLYVSLQLCCHIVHKLLILSSVDRAAHALITVCRLYANNIPQILTVFISM